MKIMDSTDFSVDLIPTKYKYEIFISFALSFNPRSDSKANNFAQIPLNRLPNENDRVIAIRIYLYSIQRIINNQNQDPEKLANEITKAIKF